MKRDVYVKCEGRDMERTTMYAMLTEREGGREREWEKA